MANPCASCKKTIPIEVVGGCAISRISADVATSVDDPDSAVEGVRNVKVPQAVKDNEIGVVQLSTDCQPSIPREASNACPSSCCDDHRGQIDLADDAARVRNHVERVLVECYSVGGFDLSGSGWPIIARIARCA